MATRTTESTNTLESFRVNFNGLVDDIGNVTVSAAGDQLNTTATTIVGAINELFVGFKLVSQISGDDSYYLQPTDTEVLTLKGGAGIHSGAETTNIVTDITADDEMSFFLNDNITGLASLQVNTITPTAGGSTDPIVFGTLLNGSGTNYNVKFASPGDTNIDYGSTQGFAAAMSVALG
mgnify:FL=1|jgi:hypothetical protein